MKSIQLKISKKNETPALWWRLVIPCGITFSQLAYLLNPIIPIDEADDFQFEFKGKKSYIQENIENELGDFNFIIIEANSTFVFDYIKDIPWFTFKPNHYFAEAYRVDIEKINEEENLLYPRIIKHRDDENRVIYINEMYKKEYTYEVGEPDFSCFKDLDTIYATTNDVNQELVYKEAIETSLISGTFDKENYLNRLFDFESQNSVFYRKLEDVFEDYNRADLLVVLESKEVYGYDNFKKRELLKVLCEHMLAEQTIRQRFMYVSDEGIAAFEALCQSGQPMALDLEEFEDLEEAYYVCTTWKGDYYVTKDVAQAYFRIKTPEFEVKRKVASRVLNCINLGIEIYGVFPMEILVKMVAVDPTIQADLETIEEIVDNIPDDLIRFERYGNDLYAYMDEESFAYLKSEHAKKGDYYIPTLEELHQFKMHGALRPKQAEELIAYLVKKHHQPKIHAEMMSDSLMELYQHGHTISSAMELLEDFDVIPESLEDAQKMASLLSRLSNNTRLPSNKGHTPNELFVRQFKPKKIKVGRNDPCPCGSGKKYKKCCMNKEELLN